MNASTIATAIAALEHRRGYVKSVLADAFITNAAHVVLSLELVRIKTAIADLEALQADSAAVDGLLPCPFCGGVAETTTFASEDSNWNAYCKICLASSGFYEKESDAIAAWNKRVSLQADSAAAPLWSDERIAEQAAPICGVSEEPNDFVDEMLSLIRRIRDDCEAKLAAPLAVDENGLLPCPFCGSNVELSYGEKMRWSIYCPICDIFVRGFFSEQEAFDNWNMRVGAAAPQPVSEWVPVEHELYEYPDGKRGLVYANADGQGRPQLRYYRDADTDTPTETVIILPEHLRLCKRVAAPMPPYGTGVAIPDDVAKTLEAALKHRRIGVWGEIPNWREGHTARAKYLDEIDTIDRALAWLDELQRRPEQEGSE